MEERDSLNPNDDLWYAMACNNPSFSRDDVLSIVAEVPGQNDELTWWWILKLRVQGQNRAKYLLLSGWCDYTGWDCRSGLDEEGLHRTAWEAATNAPEQDGGRDIQFILLGQLNGDVPFGTYTEYNGQDN